VSPERGLLSFVSTIEELLERKCGDCGLENLEYGRRDPSRRLPSLSDSLPVNVGTHFADKLRSLGRYNSLADSGHGTFLYTRRQADELLKLKVS
jgi:hypothetical protein